MTLPRTVSDVVAEQTVFEIKCIERMYLNVYVPQLQYPAGIVGYVHRSWDCRSPRPRRWARSPTPSAPRSAGLRSMSRCRGWTSPRVSARTR